MLDVLVALLQLGFELARVEVFGTGWHPPRLRGIEDWRYGTMVTGFGTAKRQRKIVVPRMELSTHDEIFTTSALTGQGVRY